MEDRPDKPSEFARALRDSGYQFDWLANHQRRLSRKATYKAIGWAAAGIVSMGAFSSNFARQTMEWPDYVATGVDFIGMVGSLGLSRNNVKKSRLFKFGSDNSSYLASLADSAKKPKN